MFNIKTWLILIVLVAAVVFVVVPLSTPTEELAPEYTQEAMESIDEVTDQVSEHVANEAPSEASSTNVDTDVHITPTPPVAEVAVTTSSQPIYLPYDTILLAKTYVLGWTSTVGSHASLVLVRGEEEVASIPDCTNMIVTPNAMQYCMWQPEPEVTDKHADGFSLRLVVKDTTGKVIQETHSQALSFVSGSRMNLVPHKDTMYGWDVRYPKAWLVKEEVAKVTFAEQASGLVAPGTSREAFTVEFCSIVYETCSTRIEEFRRVPNTAEAALGGKRSEMHIVRNGSAYVREDLFLQNGTAFFLSHTVEDVHGTLLSPFVRESLASFGFGKSRVKVTTYELDEHFRAGKLLLKYVDNSLTYLRITTSVLGCVGEIETASFTEAPLHEFKFTKNDCTVEATAVERDALKLKEDACEAFRSGECSFGGVYRPVK